MGANGVAFGTPTFCAFATSAFATDCAEATLVTTPVTALLSKAVSFCEACLPMPAPAVCGKYFADCAWFVHNNPAGLLLAHPAEMSAGGFYWWTLVSKAVHSIYR